MTTQGSDETALLFRSPRDTLGRLEPEDAARAIASAGDVALVIDKDGVIQDVALADASMAREGMGALISQRWIDTVSIESRPKVEDMLRQAAAAAPGRWREVTHQAEAGAIPIRYIAVPAGADGRVIAIGRDLRGVAALQQRLLQSQQSMEREYVRLRQAEQRYRVLFQVSSEAVFIVDAASRKIIDANPSAGRLLAVEPSTLSGLPFTRILDADSRDIGAAALLGANGAERPEAVRVNLVNDRGPCAIQASMFRQDGASFILVRVAAQIYAARETQDERRLARLIDDMPDGFVVADDVLNIAEANHAFLDMINLASAEAARGQPLSRFLGRPGVDLSVLIANAREHRVVRGFGSVVRDQYDIATDVDISAVHSIVKGQKLFAFVIRSLGRRAAGEAARDARELPRSADQFTELVGRVALKDIVRETTDIIERMCIEAALELTGDNRASAAEMLGLSRQSLYSKLHRYGLTGPDAETPP